MAETPEQENERLLRPYREARDRAAHYALSALLDGRHEVAAELVNAYQLAVMAVESAETICGWFDSGTEGEHIVID